MAKSFSIEILVSRFSISKVGLIVLLLCMFVVTKSIWNLYFHPLARFPGPKLFAVNGILSTYFAVKGQRAYKITELHNIYGPIVRVAPDELSFVHEHAWKDIYSPQKSLGGAQLKKHVPFTPQPEVLLVGQKDDDQHAKLRKASAPAFSPSEIRAREDTLQNYSTKMIRKLREQSSDNIDILWWFQCLASDVISEIVFKESFHALDNAEVPIVIHMAGRLLRNFAEILIWNRIFPLGWVYLIFKARSFTRLSDFFDKFVKERLRVWAAKGASTQEKGEAKDLISHLKKRGLTEEEMEGVSADMMIAGADTIAGAQSGLLYHLATNPTKLQAVVEEIRSSFSNESEITFSSINGLKYQNAAISESMRLFPAGPETMRRITGPSGTVICGEHVPARTFVGVYHWAAGHNKLSWKDADEFLPERWLGDDEYASDTRGVISPFQAGPRNCIGQNLAMAQIRLVLARLIWNFDIVLCEESKDWMTMPAWNVSYEKSPMMVRLTPVAGRGL